MRHRTEYVVRWQTHTISAINTISKTVVQPQGTVVTPDLSVVLGVDHGLVQLYQNSEAKVQLH